MYQAEEKPLNIGRAHPHDSTALPQLVGGGDGPARRADTASPRRRRSLSKSSKSQVNSPAPPSFTSPIHLAHQQQRRPSLAERQRPPSPTDTFRSDASWSSRFSSGMSSLPGGVTGSEEEYRGTASTSSWDDSNARWERERREAARWGGGGAFTAATAAARDPPSTGSSGKFSLKSFKSAISSKGGSSSRSTTHLPSPPSSPRFYPSSTPKPAPPISPSHLLLPQPASPTSFISSNSLGPRSKLTSKSSSLSLAASSIGEEQTTGGLRGKAARVLGETTLPTGKAAKVLGVQKEVGGAGRKLNREMPSERREVVDRIRQSPSLNTTPLPTSASFPPYPASSSSKSSTTTPTPIAHSRAPPPAPLWLPLPPPTTGSSSGSSPGLGLGEPGKWPFPSPLPGSAAVKPSSVTEEESLAQWSTTSSPSSTTVSPATSPRDRYSSHRSSDVDPSLSLDRHFAHPSSSRGHFSLLSYGLPEGVEFYSYPSAGVEEGERARLSPESIQLPSWCGSAGTTPGEEEGGESTPSSPLSAGGYFSAAPARAVESKKAKGQRQDQVVAAASPPLVSAEAPLSPALPSPSTFISHSPIISHNPPPPPAFPLPPARPPKAPTRPVRSNTLASVASSRTRGVQRGVALDLLEGRGRGGVQEREKGRRKIEGSVPMGAVMAASAVRDAGKGLGEKEKGQVEKEVRRRESRPFLDWSESDEEEEGEVGPRRGGGESQWSSSSGTSTGGRGMMMTISSPLDPFFARGGAGAYDLPPPLPTSHPFASNQPPPPPPPRLSTSTSSCPPPPPALSRATPPPAPLASRSLVSPPTAAPQRPPLRGAQGFSSYDTRAGSSPESSRPPAPAGPAPGRGSGRKEVRQSLDSGFSWLSHEESGGSEDGSEDEEGNEGVAERFPVPPGS